jgi:imidazolonepropionase-like amidohydrolase
MRPAMLAIRSERERTWPRILCGALRPMTGAIPLGPQLIEVAGDRIRSVRPATDADRGAPDVLDLAACTVVPGLIDAHTHLDFDVLAGNEGAQAAVDDATLLLRMVDRAAETLRHGVTAVRLLGSRAFLDIVLRRAVDAGDLPGPRMITATRGLTTSHSVSPNTLTVDGIDAIRRSIRENVARGADLVKIFHSGAIGSGEDATAPFFSFAELQAAVDEAHRYGRTVTAHAYGGVSVDECLEAGVDCIEHGFLMHRAQYDRAAEQGVWIVPTLGVLTAEPGIPELPHWSDEVRGRLLRGREMAWQSVGHLKASGVRFALGTDAIHGRVDLEALYGVKGGLSNLEALEAVTVSAAEVSGLRGEAGVIAPGAFADLVALGGDPLDDIAALQDVRAVVKGGAVALANTPLAPTAAS